MTISQWDHTHPGTPTTSNVTGSHAYAADALYLVFVTQYRTDSVEPSNPTVTGMGATWTDVSPASNYWDSGAPSMRKTNVLRGRPSAGGTGALTVAVASAPELLDVVVVECTESDAVVQVKGASHTANSGVLAEPLSMTAPGSSDNRWVAYVATNISAAANARLELDADTNGDADWTSFAAVQHSGSPAGTFLGGYLDAAPAGDTTPGWLQTTGSGSSYIVCVEVNKTSAPPAPSTAPRWGFVWGNRPSGGGDPPPVESGLLMGAVVKPRNGLSYTQATAQFITDLRNASGITNLAMPVARRYWDGNTSGKTFQGIERFDQDRNVRHRWISWKGEQGAAANATFMETIPDDGFITYVTQHHEPENDGGSHDEAWFKTMQANIHAGWVSIGRPDHIRPYFNLMSYQDRDASSATAGHNWFPDESIIGDFYYAIDPYDPNGNKTLEQQAGPSYEDWITHGGDPARFAIMETGSKRTGANLANWIHQGAAWARSINMVALIWFHSDVGAEGPWWLDDIQGRAAWAEEMNVTS